MGNGVWCQPGSSDSAKAPGYHNEYDYASRLLGEGLEKVKCETNDLLVPADAEIVLGGFLSKDQVESEGPFSENQGYMPASSANRQRVTVECVTFRDDPIFPRTIPGKLPRSAWASSCLLKYVIFVLYFVEFHENSTNVTTNPMN